MELAEYKKYKKIILKQMCIKLTADQVKHLNSLQTEIQVDNFARSLVMNYYYPKEEYNVQNNIHH